MPRRNKQILYQPPVRTGNCQKKQRYRTKNEATKAAEYRMSLKSDLELVVYKCPLCGKWHLTSSKEKEV